MKLRRLRLLVVALAVHFGGKLVRSADDRRARPPQTFKGAADCVSAGL